MEEIISPEEMKESWEVAFELDLFKGMSCFHR